MMVFGLTTGVVGLLILGILLAVVLPWAYRSISQSLEEFRTNPEDSDSRW